MERRGVGSLFCNDEEEEQPENEYVFEKTGSEEDNYTEDLNDSENEYIPIGVTENKDKHKRSKSITIKIYDDDVNKFEQLKKALWVENDSEVVKKCLDKVYKSNKKKIERIIEERSRIEEVKNSIGTL